MNNDQQIVNELESIIGSKPNYLDFNGVDMNYSTHKYHDYPATMIPKLPDLFLNVISKFTEVKSLYDPFMGSGTTLVEGIRHGINSTGIDLNPLAALMSRVKTKKLNQEKLLKYRKDIYSGIEKEKREVWIGSKELKTPNFKNIDYWYKPYVIKELQIIRDQIEDIKDVDYREFFLLAFSGTVRYVSNTRNGEFKMYRMAPKTLEKWEPDVIGKFKEILDKNIDLNGKLKEPQATASVILGTSMKTDLPDNSFDMLITSPPYGDSRTTVAYGQFSRTSLQWLDLDEMPAGEVPKIDRKLLGGTLRDKEIRATASPTLNKYVREIEQKDEKRALEVIQFYDDLYVVLKECYRVMKPNSYQVWVTANRTVKQIQLPTDVIISELYASLGVKKLAEFTRNIPNKRMPSKNSPTNKKGKKNATMKQENIVLYKTIK
jgi:site-specific DNA-methyltransferase (cytosine-N4-specific)